MQTAGWCMQSLYTAHKEQNRLRWHLTALVTPPVFTDCPHQGYLGMLKKKARNHTLDLAHRSGQRWFQCVLTVHVAPFLSLSWSRNVNIDMSQDVEFQRQTHTEQQIKQHCSRLSEPRGSFSLFIFNDWSTRYNLIVVLGMLPVNKAILIMNDIIINSTTYNHNIILTPLVWIFLYVIYWQQ